MPFARFTNADQTTLAWTNDEGREWHGIKCHFENDKLVIDGDGEVPRKVRNWIAAGNVIAPYSEPSDAVAARIASARSRVVAFADALAEQITGPVPAAEKLGWDKKEAAARAHVAGVATAAQTAMLEGELEAAGGLDADLDDLAVKIIAKADFYALAVARIAGIRRRAMAAIDALGARPTQADLEATLAQAMTEAEAAFAALT